MANDGRVTTDRYRGPHIDFRSVKWPGRTEGRRIKINRAPGYGRFTSEDEAEKCRLEILAQSLHKPLYDVLSQYLRRETPENSAGWNHDFLPAKWAKHQRKGKPSRKRIYELERYEHRGHLDFWAEISIHSVNESAFERWVAWLETKFPHLAPRTIKHLVDDFWTFLRHEKKFGVIDQVPERPEIEVPAHQPKVPNKSDRDRLLRAIPWSERGLFIARTLAGLRPSEARRLDVGDYDFRAGELRIQSVKSKTQRGRDLPIRDVVPALDEWIVEHRAEAKAWKPLFPNPRAENPEGRWMDRAERLVWTRAEKICGFEHIRPNEGGRHSFATHEIGDGTDVYAVKDWMGHTSLKSTERYTTISTVTLARRMRPKRGTKSEQEQKESPK